MRHWQPASGFCQPREWLIVLIESVMDQHCVALRLQLHAGLLWRQCKGEGAGGEVSWSGQTRKEGSRAEYALWQGGASTDRWNLTHHLSMLNTEIWHYTADIHFCPLLLVTDLLPLEPWRQVLIHQMDQWSVILLTMPSTCRQKIEAVLFHDMMLACAADREW